MKIIEKLAIEYAEDKFEPFSRAYGMFPSDIAEVAYQAGFRKALEMAADYVEDNIDHYDGGSNMRGLSILGEEEV